MTFTKRTDPKYVVKRLTLMIYCAISAVAGVEGEGAGGSNTNHTIEMRLAVCMQIWPSKHGHAKISTGFNTDDNI